jgi:hypothetical protein
MVIPTREDFIRIIELAKEKGSEAAKQRYDYLLANKGPKTQLMDVCGGAFIVLKLDGRTKLAHFLLSLDEPQFRISKTTFGGLTLDILGMAPYQEKTVCEAAERAALNVIKEALNIEGYVKGYID